MELHLCRSCNWVSMRGVQPFLRRVALSFMGLSSAGCACSGLQQVVHGSVHQAGAQCCTLSYWRSMMLLVAMELCV